MGNLDKNCTRCTACSEPRESLCGVGFPNHPSVLKSVVPDVVIVEIGYAIIDDGGVSLV